MRVHEIASVNVPVISIAIGILVRSRIRRLIRAHRAASIDSVRALRVE